MTDLGYSAAWKQGYVGAYFAVFWPELWFPTLKKACVCECGVCVCVYAREKEREKKQELVKKVVSYFHSHLLVLSLLL